MAVGGGLGLIIAIVFMLMQGGNLGDIVGQIGGGGGGGAGTATGTESGGEVAYQPTPQEEETRQFLETVLADTEQVWHKLFRQVGRTYKEPTLVWFTGRVKSACGLASSAVGPFYCPGDHKVYIDLSFLQEMKRRLGAGGDFAQAYVLAHEVGHHVQNLLGSMDRMRSMERGRSQAYKNQLSVRLELQADYFAGVFAHHVRQYLDRTDIEEAVNAARAIGDDTLQKRGQGYVQPEKFTHGSSRQRMAWFKRGFEFGNLDGGNTFDDGLFNQVSPR